MTDFAAVDAGDGRDLVAMMDATDAWPAVRAGRAWVVEQVELGADAIVVDAGCGPGTFGGLVHGCAIDVDTSQVMVRETRRRRLDARVVLGDAAHLPLRDGSADLVHAERVLQWADDPPRVVAELRRIVTPAGWLAVTDTDWGTFTVEHQDPRAAARLARAALEWIPHPRVARDLPDLLAALDMHAVAVREDVVVITAWDPDDPAQHDGPPGLPLRSIAGEFTAALGSVADTARAGRFHAEVTLVTALGRA